MAKPKTLETFFDEWHTVKVDIKFIVEATRWCISNVSTVNLKWNFDVNINTITFKFKDKNPALLFLLRFGE